MLHSVTNSQVLDADGQVLIRQVMINGVPYWQASTGRTFPQVAGGEDPPPADTDTDKDTSGTGDAGDPPEKWDEERAKRTIANLRAKEKEAAAKLKELDAFKAKEAQREREKLSETERLAAEKADLERQIAERDAALRETRTEQALERAAVALGARKPTIVVKLIDRTALQYGDDGAPTNADKLVKDLLAAEPYLVGKADAPNGVPATPRGSGSATRDDQVNKNREELRGSPHYQPLG